MGRDLELRSALEGIVGAANVLTDGDMVAGFVTDWTGRYVGSTAAVVRPATTSEVAAVLAACTERGRAVVPQGGNTGLVGGGVPLAGEIVLSLRRLRRLDPVDAASAQVTVGAGVTLGELQAHAAAAGLAYGVDLGARDSATVGGTVATNAGGLNLLRYGGTREQVVGYEAVLADGSVLSHLGGLLKDNTGFDLAGLLCGSEGTLAVVTAVRVRLRPHYSERVTCLLAFDAPYDAIAAVTGLRDRLDQLEAAELFFADGLDLVCAHTGAPEPFSTRHAAYVLAEIAGRTDPTDALADAVAGLDGVADAAVVGADRRHELWRYREAHTEAINALGPPHKLDVTLPSRHLAGFCDRVRSTVGAAYPAASTWLFGHAADGNIHVNVTGVDPLDEGVDELVLELVASLDGSISAEHGIGTAKRRWLHLNRSAAELEAFAAIKRALDPNGTLNPNVLLP